MCSSYSTKKYSFTTVWIMAVMFLAVGSNCVQAGPENPLHYQIMASAVERTPQTALVINSACDHIFRGDFESAKQIIGKLTISDSQDRIQLRAIIDASIRITTQRKALQDEVYRTLIDELEELRQKDLLDNVNDISKVFSVVLKISEYADKEQKQALLKDRLLIRTIQKAKVKAAEFEAKGKWLDAYTICYSNLKRIYEDNDAYSDYAVQLLKKADILESLQDSPCETCQWRYAGIKKQMFINAVNVLDSSYVDIIDYRQMAIKGIDCCKLLAEVMSNYNLESNYKLSSEEFVTWSEALETVADEIDQSQTGIGKDGLIDVFEKVLALNRSSYAETALSDTLVIAHFTEGALSSLDPYTVIYWPSRVQEFEKALTNQFSGIGIKFSKQEGLAKVVTVLPDTPAYKSGLQTGDIIRAVDGIEIKDIPSDCVAKRITGPEETKVTLTIMRFDDNKIRDITLNRAKITVPSVHGWRKDRRAKQNYMIDEHDRIGYVRISSFNSETTYDFETAINQLEKNGLKGLILDLRSNPGGLLKSAVEIADKFIEKGLLVRTQPRFGMSTYIAAKEDGTLENYPLVVLINNLTASSSEVLAGALCDEKYKRAVLVGQKSYGKGSVQSTTRRCGENTQLKYTIAYYYLPSGTRVQSREAMEKQGRTDWGITPDILVKLQDNELQKIADMQKANDSAVTIKQNNVFNRINNCSSQEVVSADPQLAIGLLALKSKMIRTGHELTIPD